MIKKEVFVMIKREQRTRPQLEAVTADGEILVFYRGGNVETNKAPRKVSVGTVPLQLEEDPRLRPYRHADLLREITGSDRPDREY
ncbi:MAG: hypothetical protein MUF61_02375 [archaeon]|jgi:hypothetical protein|nr:hypothetical protein [archaeon]